MMRTTKPPHVQSFGVIVVVGFYVFGGSTLLTGTALNLAALDVRI